MASKSTINNILKKRRVSKIKKAIEQSTPPNPFESTSSQPPTQNPKRTIQKKEKKSTPRFSLHPKTWFLAGSVVSTISIILGIAGGTPWIISHWDYTVIAIAAVVAIAAYVLAIKQHNFISKKLFMITSSIELLLVILTIVGVTNSVVIQGKVYPATSATAKAYRLSVSLRNDIFTLAGYDSLLKASPSKARAQYNLYGIDASNAQAISAKWAAVPVSSLPSPAFAPVIQEVSNAGYWQAKALHAEANYIIQPDSTLANSIASYRATYISDLLTAGPDLGRIAKLYNFHILPSQSTPSE